MTPAQRKFLRDLIHAAFERAHSQGFESPIDLAPFGKLLRELEPGFTHQAYGHEKLLYLLRGEFPELLHIRKDQEVDPPRYYVSIRRGPPRPAHRQQPFRPESARMPPVLDPGLVDGGLLERYLASLAESSARTQQRFGAIDRRLAGIQDELAQSRANEIKMNTEIRELDARLMKYRTGASCKHCGSRNVMISSSTLKPHFCRNCGKYL
ncbi:OST-HTH/LOTUS domain-containing protein [Malikia sp.]|uniref:OST-HTH/LOTUS domain-containing protein n=1 Tax=Malikia sp. TaxID=2070706 RepID=UPI0026204617|nr:OST-HTH/LOTUS domain-containing protein [Malikia sp.]MDD2728420.1 OST-HTH/LOTUS domain-containing protein [Malikia sp.]